MKNLEPVYVLVAGGTGGHLFPAISLASTLSEAGKRVILFTDERAEAWAQSKHIEKVFVLHFKYANHGWRKIFFLLRLMRYGLKGLWLFLKDRPVVVVGFGSYVSAPILLASQLLKIPTVIHEQNTILGRANRILAKRVKRIATGVKDITTPYPDKQIFVGNPVRKEILKLYNHPHVSPGESDNVNILIIGGSQGADIFSQVIPHVLTSFDEAEQKRLKVCQQVSRSWMKKTGLLYKESFIEVNLQEFFKEMPALLQWSHLAIARAGASSLTEFSIAGIPSILVPFARSRDGDQLHNAKYYQSHGAAIVIEESDFSPEYLKKTLDSLIHSKEKLQKMSDAAKSLAMPDANQKFCDLVIQIAELDKH